MAAHEGVKLDPAVWLPLFDEYRLTTLPRETLLRGTLLDGLDPTSPDVVEALSRWPARAHFAARNGRTEVVLVYQLKPPSARVPIVNLVLLLATVVTTLGSGALMLGVDPFDTRILDWGTMAVPYPTGLHFGRLWVGASFAFPFLAVLLTHEMGHWVAARRNSVPASLPYFIPFPPYLSVIGSLGAFIRLRGRSVERSVLFDIGASGPIASLAVSVPMFAWGLGLSQPVPGPASAVSPFLIRFTGQPIFLGNGLLTHLLASTFGPGSVGETLIALHPVALAGWLGLFVTALNLLPLGQLDGGHVLYSLSPRRHERVARLFVLALLPLGLLWWGWWAWGALVLFIHRGRVVHPPVLLPEVAMGRTRVLLAWILIVTFLVTMIPVPITL